MADVAAADPELSVLVVEDDQEMRALLRRILEGTGYRVLERGRADGLPEALQELRVDVVVLDKEMPGTGGLQALAQLRRSHPRLPVILITAFGGPGGLSRRAARIAPARTPHWRRGDTVTGSAPPTWPPSGAVLSPPPPSSP